MAASSAGMFCQKALGKVTRSSGIFCMDFRPYSNRGKKKSATSTVTVDVKSIYSPGVSQTERNDKPLSYQHILKLRRDEAKKSVLIQLAKGGSENQVYQRLEKHGKIKKAFHFEHIKNYVLIEFERKAAIQNVFRDAGHFQSKAKVPVQSRLLYFELGSGSARSKSYPIMYEDFKSHEMVSFKSLKSISEQIIQHHKSKDLTNLGTRLRFFICSTIEDMISGFLPHLRIEPFGSSVNGFGWWNCDLDMMIEMLPPHTERTESRLKFLTKKIHEDERVYSQRSLALLGDMLQLVMPSCYNVTKILNARVPIVKFKYECVNLECDLSFWNVSGAKMSELMYIFGESDPRIRPLVSVLKQWARAKVLTKTSPGPWPTNFMFLMLMIYYLQTCKILPSIRAMQEIADRDDEFDIDGVTFAFVTDINKLSKTGNKQTLEELLVGFFTFYVNFDFKSRGISLIEATDFVKPDFSPVYIENPFELGANISKNVSTSEVQRLQAEIEQALCLLNSNNSAKGSEPWGIMGLLVNGNGPPDTNIRISELYPDVDSEILDDSTKRDSHLSADLSASEHTKLSSPVAEDVQDFDNQSSNEIRKNPVT